MGRISLLIVFSQDHLPIILLLDHLYTPQVEEQYWIGLCTVIVCLLMLGEMKATSVKKVSCNAV